MAIRSFLGAATLLIAVGPVAAQDQTKPAPPIAVPQSYGRYQIVTSQFTERNIFLLDTDTGAVWQLQVSTSLIGEPLIWNIIPRVDNDDEMARLVAKFGKKPAAKTIPSPLISPTPR